MYQENDNDIKNSLVTLLLKALVTKMSGQKNAQYDDKVRNFFIALAASGNKQAYKFVSGNLSQCMTIRHAKRCIGQCRSTPFISIEDAEVERFLALVQRLPELTAEEIGGLTVTAKAGVLASAPLPKGLF